MTKRIDLRVRLVDKANTRDLADALESVVVGLRGVGKQALTPGQGFRVTDIHGNEIAWASIVALKS